MTSEKPSTKLDDIIRQMTERIQNSEIAIENTNKEIETEQKRNNEISTEIESKRKMVEDFIQTRDQVLKEQVSQRVEPQKKDAIHRKEECEIKISEAQAQLAKVDETLMKWENEVQRLSTKTKRLNLIYNEKKKHGEEIASGNELS